MQDLVGVNWSQDGLRWAETEHLKRLASVVFRDTLAHGLSGYPTNIVLCFMRWKYSDA
jgi:hypothetical protein